MRKKTPQKYTRNFESIDFIWTQIDIREISNSEIFTFKWLS